MPEGVRPSRVVPRGSDDLASDERGGVFCVPSKRLLETGGSAMVRSTEVRTSMRLNGARAICQSLVEEGVSTIFGLPGGAIMPLYDVLPEFQQLRHILVRHEQCAGHMADGYARAAAAIKKPQEKRT